MDIVLALLCFGSIVCFSKSEPCRIGQYSATGYGPNCKRCPPGRYSGEVGAKGEMRNVCRARCMTISSTCTESVLDAMGTDAGGTYSCLARVEYLVRSNGYSERAACAKVGGEFPVECGRCAPGQTIRNYVNQVHQDRRRDELKGKNSTGVQYRSNTYSVRKGLLSHYFSYIEPTLHLFREGGWATRGNQKKANGVLETSSIIFAVIGSCALEGRLFKLDRTWCDNEHHPGIGCRVYIDCELEQAPTVRSVRLIPPSEYLRLKDSPAHAPQSQCCNRSISVFDKSTYDGHGPSDFYCPNGRHGSNDDSGAHRKATLLAQYRYLPAIQHAVIENKARFQKGEASWLVLVDDDTWVTIPRLLDVLSKYRHGAKVQLGDFVFAPIYNETHWKRPFACGGAGTILSAAAAVTVSWAKCMRLFHDSCMQSDWMIGRCLNEYPEIVPDMTMSCGVCARDTIFSTAHIAKIEGLAMSRKCAFAQVTSDIPSLDSGSLFNKPSTLSWFMHLMASSATLHLKGSIWNTFTFDCLGGRGGESNLTASSGGGAADFTLPQTMIIGAQKAGTTAVWSSLMHHVKGPGSKSLFCWPQVASSQIPSATEKELALFGRRACRQIGVNAYKRLFPATVMGKPCRYMDATPLIASERLGGVIGAYQVFYSYSVQELRQLKLLAVLREPVSRLISWYVHLQTYAPTDFCKDTGNCSSWKCSLATRCFEERRKKETWMAKVAFRNDIRTGMRVACANNPLLVGQKRISCFTIDPRSDIFTEVLSFEAFVHFFPTCLHTGIYAPALTVWRNYFGTDALKVWSYNAFTDSPASAYSEALHHITGGSQYSVNARLC